MIPRLHRRTPVTTPKGARAFHFLSKPFIRSKFPMVDGFTLGGSDRNLDDVGNDRPSFRGVLSQIRWRESGSPLDSGFVEAFSLLPVGSAGHLRRNAARPRPLYP